MRRRANFPHIFSNLHVLEDLRFHEDDGLIEVVRWTWSGRWGCIEVFTTSTSELRSGSSRVINCLKNRCHPLEKGDLIQRVAKLIYVT
ncbi:hypothetical protein VTH8203_02243 [Vibrio thalassae]|uniref:Uncharacterized protein n=1 Tax=Vibrio thalassae TaxID=1243014 RepID=A0A240EIV9_9VIBR|nr:hypothetical protein VTH8203_02243 [Vibrio thalassae]